MDVLGFDDVCVLMVLPSAVMEGPYAGLEAYQEELDDLPLVKIEESTLEETPEESEAVSIEASAASSFDYDDFEANKYDNISGNASRIYNIGDIIQVEWDGNFYPSRALSLGSGEVCEAGGNAEGSEEGF